MRLATQSSSIVSVKLPVTGAPRSGAAAGGCLRGRLTNPEHAHTASGANARPRHSGARALAREPGIHNHKVTREIHKRFGHSWGVIDSGLAPIAAPRNNGGGVHRLLTHLNAKGLSPGAK